MKIEMTHATFDLNNIDTYADNLLKYSKQLSISLLIIIRGWHSAMYTSA